MKEGPGYQHGDFEDKKPFHAQIKSTTGKSQNLASTKLSSSLSREPSLFLLNEDSGQQIFSCLRLCSEAGICLPASSVTTKAASQHLALLLPLVSPTTLQRSMHRDETTSNHKHSRHVQPLPSHSMTAQKRDAHRPGKGQSRAATSSCVGMCH